jgi:5'-nucleotidase / UDP-sugar diphosphatase
MKKILFLFVLISLIIPGCLNGKKGVKKIMIIYSGNIGGKKDPCGCSPTMGGYARKATVVSALKQINPNLISLDSGAMLYPNNFLAPPTDFVFGVEGLISAKVADEIGLDAINASSFDLANSVDSLLSVDKGTSYPWISANLKWRKSGELVFPADLEITKGDAKVGVFGVMSDNFMGTRLFTDKSPVDVTDFVDAAKSEVNKLKKNDLIVALAYLSIKEAEVLAQEVPSINVIILSHNGYHNPTSDHASFMPKKIGKTLIVRPPDGGRVVGCLELEIVNGSTDFTEVSDMEVRGARLNKNNDNKKPDKSTFINTFFDLSPDIKSDEKILAQLDSVTAIIKAYKDSLGLE